MTLRIWSLPVDVPWKRLAVDEDMYATDYDTLPAKWRSSIAVYSYEPVPDPGEPEDPDERTLFLKVAVSITGYQPGPLLRMMLPKGRLTVLGNTLQTAVQKLDVYHPAYSALLQVAVFPVGGDWPVTQYPYFSDFEPKKRELIELVTDTGESATQSTNTLNVRKGSTTTDSTEKLQIDRGSSIGASVSTPYGGIGVSKSDAREVGTRSTSGAEGTNVITTDASQEKRETYAHTTNLSQLYQLLDSYHVGTNRALFFVNARPHLKQSPYTFVNGPRRLEGVQEFFLVVRRPKQMEQICVKAVLETAHLHETDTEFTTGQLRYDEREVTQTYSLHAIHENGGYAESTPGKWTIPIPEGFWLDTTKGGGPYRIQWGSGQVCEGVIPNGVTWSFSGSTSEKFVCDAVPKVNAYWDHVDIEATVVGATEQDGQVDYSVTVYFKSIQPIETPQKKVKRHWDVFVTANEITSCAGRTARRDFVSFEREVTEQVGDKMEIAQGTGPESLVAANAVGRVVREELALSLGSALRYAPGKVGFLASQTALRALMPAASHFSSAELGRPIAEAVAPPFRSHVAHAGRMTIAEALASDPRRLAEKLRISVAEARGVMISALAPSSADRTAAEKLSSVVRSTGADKPHR